MPGPEFDEARLGLLEALAAAGGDAWADACDCMRDALEAFVDDPAHGDDPQLDACRSAVVWLRIAAAVSRNDPGSAVNVFCQRALQVATGETSAARCQQLQLEMSGAVAREVIGAAIRERAMPDIGDVIATELAVARERAGLTPAAWAGAAFFWNVPLPGRGGQTVGACIGADAAEYERFLEITARAAVQAGAALALPLPHALAVSGITVPEPVRRDLESRIARVMASHDGHGPPGAAEETGVAGCWRDDVDALARLFDQRRASATAERLLPELHSGWLQDYLELCARGEVPGPGAPGSGLLPELPADGGPRWPRDADTSWSSPHVSLDTMSEPEDARDRSFAFVPPPGTASALAAWDAPDDAATPAGASCASPGAFRPDSWPLRRDSGPSPASCASAPGGRERGAGRMTPATPATAGAACAQRSRPPAPRRMSAARAAGRRRSVRRPRPARPRAGSPPYCAAGGRAISACCAARIPRPRLRMTRPRRRRPPGRTRRARGRHSPCGTTGSRRNRRRPPPRSRIR
ncbi:hypothetical protein ACFOEX_09755, partial [Camelimonas abortus]